MEKFWNNYLKKFILLNIGFFLCSLGIVMIIKSGTGYTPWDVFCDGLSKITGLSIGRAVIAVSVSLVIIEAVSGTSIGIGTLLNMYFIGYYVDLINDSGIFITPQNIFFQFLLLFIGSVSINFGVWAYMSQGLGSGPRDGLMLLLAKKLNLSVGHVKMLIEIVVVVVGIIMGGSFGIGTVLVALFSGMLMNYQFKLVGFEPKKLEHKYIGTYFKKS